MLKNLLNCSLELIIAAAAVWVVLWAGADLSGL